MSFSPLVGAVPAVAVLVADFNLILFSNENNFVSASANNQDDDTEQGSSVGTGLIAEKSKVKPKKPPLYKVLLLNDDYTPMEFVVLLLMRFFSMTQENAEQIMLHVHTKGFGICGVFPREIAETKVRLVMDFANESQHPLQCTFEKE